MKRFFKKAIAGAMAAATFFSCALTASAYSDSGSWNFYINPHASHTTDYYNMNYYSGGYSAMITNKDNGGSYNAVLISENNTTKALLTEEKVRCGTFYATSHNTDNYGSFYVTFNAEFYVESSVGKTAYNIGEIKLSNMF